ncbi:phosphatidate cytidylyltransferase [Halalkalibacterium halodurans]|uniref:phosphatidate cytidylyltransferase n=1 Tax=Halalkalibacterium halodurans TaxID=86665 RepID=UPI0010FCF77E|nr:phosphatidate cytidylyltransferase [Halalkalibacterium halodurans]MED3646201.1 phosphatidate cytidylyltransferase [Halalkalibacterium halodurans]MED4164394.1 phosphatidate cytidylyltransferase [Halalkalibacterium halodurans]
MKQRVVTAIIFGLVFLTFVVVGGLPFTMFIIVVATIAMSELLKMKKIAPYSPMGAFSLLPMWMLLLPNDWFKVVIPDFTKVEIFIFFILFLLLLTVLTKNTFTFDEAGFVILSSAYIGYGFHFLLLSREIPEIGLPLVFFVLFVIWATDSGAYFAGRAFGKHKLWPHISPNKTIEGSIGGIILAVIIGSLFYWIMPLFSSYGVALAVIVVASVFGQLGDLVESALKRHYAVKDSGTVLPGHGGILDRFDSLIYVMPILHLLHLL